VLWILLISQHVLPATPAGCYLMRFPFCRLKHPNIVQLLDVFDDKSHVYLVMEL